MKRIIFFVLPVFFLLVFSGCTKSKLKKPTSVNFSFTIDKTFDQNAALKFVSGDIKLSNFNVSGNREEGKDIAFTRSFNSELNIDLNGSGEIRELDYDIPQGVYNEIRIDFSTPSGSNSNTLAIEGTYKPISAATLAIKFELSSGNLFQIMGNDIDGTDLIVLDASKSKKVDIELDPLYWFETVPTSMIDNADLVDVEGEMTILVNATTNIEIYNLVIGRINQSNTAIFK